MMNSMSEPRRWWIEDNEANREVPAEVARPRYVEVIEADPVLARIKQLEAQLKEANAVAEFYAKKSSWSRGEEAFDVCISDSEGWPVSRGGTRARAYLKKWEGEK